MTIEGNHGFYGYRSGRWSPGHFALYAMSQPNQWVAEQQDARRVGYPRVIYRKFGGLVEWLVDISPYHHKLYVHRKARTLINQLKELGYE